MNEEKIIQKLLEHDDRFEKLESKMDELKTEFIVGQEQMMTILKRLDQERIFTAEWIRRVESEVENHTREISRIKENLKIV